MDVDIAIVGGGIQGLVALRELAAEGYACVLIANAPLGSGQTLHSHGALISGTGLVTGELSRTVETVTVPYLRRLGVSLQRESPFFLVAPDEMVGALAPVWEANGYSPHRSAGPPLPGFEPDAPPYRVPGCNVDRRELVQALARGLDGLIVRGEVVGADKNLQVVTPHGQLQVRSRAVVVAAGCGTKALLHSTFGVDGGLVERITYSKMHMICLQAPPGVLPAIGAVVSPELFVAGHQQGAGGASGVTWLATPVDPSAVVHPEAPNPAEVELLLVARAITALRRFFPALRRDHHHLQATVFAGYKQDLDGQPTSRACVLVDHDRNIVVVLPSVLANAVPNGRDTVALLRQRVEPSGRPVRVPGTARVAVGDPEERSRHDWRDWRSFARAYRS